MERSYTVFLSTIALTMSYRPLQAADVADLLRFELANRAWFERIIPAREESMYTEAGIEAHIQSCLNELQLGTMYPGVVLDADGRIAGRVNLRFINHTAGSGEVGYRIAEDHCGKGLASGSVRWLQEAAYGPLGLSRLEAYASVENPVSARVLEKSGFVRRELIAQRSKIGERWLDAYRYEHIPA